MSRVPGTFEVGPKVFTLNIDRLNERRTQAESRREHLWVYTGLWEVRDPRQRQRVDLDTENLLSVDGPGCFICERMWSARLAARPCEGEP
jgi:hypothetical protein